MDHVSALKIANCCHGTKTGLGFFLAAFLGDGRPAFRHDDLREATDLTEARIRRVDDRVRSLFGDVALNDINGHSTDSVSTVYSRDLGLRVRLLMFVR